MLPVIALLAVGTGCVNKHKEKEFDYEKSCRNGYNTSCTFIAKNYLNGSYGVKKDLNKAFELYEIACNLKDPEGCFKLGELYYDKRTVLDNKKAKNLWERGCFSRVPNAPLNEQVNGYSYKSQFLGCYRLGLLYERGIGGEQDYSKAATLYDKACYEGPIGNPKEACEKLGNLYYNGIGIKKNYSKAAAAYERACELYSGEGCLIAGNMYSEGKIVKRDSAKAKSYYQSACRRGYSSACDHLENRGKQVDYTQTESYFNETKQACDRGDRSSCRNLGKLYLRDDGFVKKDPHRAILAFQNACLSDDAASCLVLGTLYTDGVYISPNIIQARAYYIQACQLGMSSACVIVGNFSRSGY
jgi:TPR repeat protein